MNRKNEIIEIALEKFSKNGYQGTTLENISQSIGIKKASLYSHFNNKDEIYDLCIEKCINKGIENLNIIHTNKDISKIEIYNFSKKYIFDDMKYIGFYFQMQSAPQIHQKKIKKLNKKKQEIIENIFEILLKNDKNIELKIIHIRTFFNGWLTRRYFSKDEEILNITIKEFDKDFNFLYELITEK